MKNVPIPISVSPVRHIHTGHGSMHGPGTDRSTPESARIFTLPAHPIRYPAGHELN